MMTDRDKLIKLLDYISYGQEFSCYDFYDMSDAADSIADFLISKGVTVQQWRDAKTDPPEEEKPVQCFFVNCQCVGFWTKEKGYKQWFASVGDLYFECESEPDYWQPLPEPPKEES